MLRVIRYLTLGFRDLFNRKVLLVAIFPFILTSFLFVTEAIVAVFWAIPWAEGLLKQEISTINQGWTEKISHWFASGFFDIVTSLVLGIGFIGFLAIINVFLAILLIGVFFTEKLIAQVNNARYQVQLQPFATTTEIILFAFKALGKLLLLFILLSPLYFIPLINIFALALPSYLYLKSTVLFDVASLSTTKENYRAIVRQERFFLYLLTIPLYLLIYVPFVNIFSYIFAFLVVTHFFLDHLAGEQAGGRGHNCVSSATQNRVPVRPADALNRRRETP